MDRLEEHILPIENIINQYVKEHFSDLKENLKENNNSFIFLEKSSLNLLLTSLLSMATNSTSIGNNEVLDLTIIEKLDAMIAENKKEFDALLNTLREFT
jgi:hypothetical protein